MKKSIFAATILGIIALNGVAHADFVPGRVRAFMRCSPTQPTRASRGIELLSKDGSPGIVAQLYVPGPTDAPVPMERFKVLQAKTLVAGELIYLDTATHGNIFRLVMKDPNTNGVRPAMVYVNSPSGRFSQAMGCQEFFLTM